MKRLADFRRRSGRPVGASFVDSRLYMSIELDRGLLTTSATERLDDFEVAKTCYEDLVLCFGIVEDLNLDTRIWSKA